VWSIQCNEAFLPASPKFYHTTIRLSNRFETFRLITYGTATPSLFINSHPGISIKLKQKDLDAAEPVFGTSRKAAEKTKD